jgi:hypothetical protein
MLSVSCGQSKIAAVRTYARTCPGSPWLAQVVGVNLDALAPGAISFGNGTTGVIGAPDHGVGQALIYGK